MIRTTILVGALAIGLSATAFAFGINPSQGGPRGEVGRDLMSGISRDVPASCAACRAAWGPTIGSGSTTNPQNLGSGPTGSGSGSDPSGMGIGGGVQGNDPNDVSGNSVGY